MSKKEYTIAELSAATSLIQISGRAQTGATKAVRYKVVPLADGEIYAEAIVVAYGGRSPVVISEPAKRTQFLYRGC